jgi:hypothetical protein
MVEILELYAGMGDLGSGTWFTYSGVWHAGEVNGRRKRIMARGEGE